MDFRCNVLLNVSNDGEMYFCRIYLFIGYKLGKLPDLLT